MSNPYEPPRVEHRQTSLIEAPDGKTCPACGEQVGFFRVYFAWSPNHIRCGRCRAVLRYRHIVGPGLGVLVVVLLLGAATAFVAQFVEGPFAVTWPLLFAGSAALAAIPVAFYARARNRLVVERPPEPRG